MKKLLVILVVLFLVLFGGKSFAIDFGGAITSIFGNDIDGVTITDSPISGSTGAFTTLGIIEGGNMSMTHASLASGTTGSYYQVCCKHLPAIGDLTFSGVSPSRSFFFYGTPARIRDNGTVTRFKVYTVGSTNLTGIKLGIWREVSANSFNMIGSDTVTDISGFVTNGISTFNLPTGIPNVQPGDYVELELICTGICAALSLENTAVTNVDLYRLDGAHSETAFAWRSQTKSDNSIIPVEVFMSVASQVVFFGDSIIAGHNSNYSFVEEDPLDPEAGGVGAITNTVDLTHSIAYEFGQLTGYTYQNIGIGSRTIDGLLIRFDTGCSAGIDGGPCVIDLAPRLIVMNGGTVDSLISPPTPIEGVSSFLADWKSILDAADTAGIPVITIGATHSITGTIAQDRIVDQYNFVVNDLCATYDNCRYVDPRPYLQATAPAQKVGDDDNLWAISQTTPDYSDGGSHYTNAGNAQIAQAILDTLNSWKIEDDGSTKPLLVVNEGGEGVGIGESPLGSVSVPANPLAPLGYGLSVKGKVKTNHLIATGIIETSPLDYSVTRKFATMPLKYWGYCQALDDNEIIELPIPATANVGMGFLTAWTSEGDWIEAIIPQTGIPIVKNDGANNQMIGDWEVQADVASCTDTKVCLYEETTSSAPAIKNLIDTVVTTVCVVYWFN